MLSQSESYELTGYLKAALKEIEALPSVDAVAAAAAPEPAQTKPKNAVSANGVTAKVSSKPKPRKTAKATRKTASPSQAAAAKRAGA